MHFSKHPCLLWTIWREKNLSVTANMFTSEFHHTSTKSHSESSKNLPEHPHHVPSHQAQGKVWLVRSNYPRRKSAKEEMPPSLQCSTQREFKAPWHGKSTFTSQKILPVSSWSLDSFFSLQLARNEPVGHKVHGECPSQTGSGASARNWTCKFM